MRILFLSRLYLPHVGGVENHLAHVNHYLRQEHEVTVITEQYHPTLPLSEVIEEVNVQRIPGMWQGDVKLKVWWWFLKNWRLIWSADVIHIHDVFFWHLPFRFLFFWKKVFMTFHGYEGNNLPSQKQISWHWLASKLTYGNMCIGEFHRKWYHVQPTVISFGGVEFSVRHTKKRKQKQQKVLNLLFVGRLAEDTGIRQFIEAIRTVAADQKIHLDVFGDGELAQELKVYVTKYSLPVAFHGRVKTEEIDRTKYDIACASQYLAILESLANNLPVVAFSYNQLKYDYLMMSPFAKWIKITQSSGEIANWLKKGRHLLPEGAVNWARHQTWEKVAQQYQELWKI